MNMKISKILEVSSNSKAVTLVVLFELLFHAIIYFTGADSSKWHFLAWFVLLVTITSVRFYFNRNLKFKSTSQLIQEDDQKRKNHLYQK